jgi:diguanylate cyclase
VGDNGQSREQAEFCARNALSRMAVLGITPTPQNFLVWYSYFSNQPPSLKKAVDQLVEGGRTADAALSDEIHNRFFGQEAEAAEVMAASETVDALLARLMERVSAQARGAEAYGGALADAESALKGGEIGGLLARLTEETHRMAALNLDMQAHLKAAGSEIDGLRRSLGEARVQAETDGLTGIANRKRFDQAIHQSIAQATKAGEALTLLMVDIDHFKRFNDTHGHLVGDQVLRLVARTLTDCVRGGDLPARYGGEEFAVILPRTALAAARPIAERIRTTLAARKIVRRNTGEGLGGITISIGAALYYPGETPAALIARADSALYSAKRQGRNRLVVEGESAG